MTSNTSHLVIIVSITSGEYKLETPNIMVTGKDGNRSYKRNHRDNTSVSSLVASYFIIVHIPLHHYQILGVVMIRVLVLPSMWRMMVVMPLIILAPVACFGMSTQNIAMQATFPSGCRA
jgi:hypothetical protein